VWVQAANRRRLYGRFYTFFRDPHTIYLKVKSVTKYIMGSAWFHSPLFHIHEIHYQLDDDLVYIQDGAIEAIVREKLSGHHLFVPI